MDQATFVRFVAAAAKKAVASDGRIGHLVPTQATDNMEPRLREPEMRHALAQIAEEMSVWYGIESPTDQGYRFTTEPGERTISARHDFVLLAEPRHDADKLNLLELKKDQPKVVANEYGDDCPKIRKDFQKLLLEKAVDGKCMLHLCHAANSATIPSLLDKYNAAIRHAVRLSQPTAVQHGLQNVTDDRCWFELFILVVRMRGRAAGNRPALFHQSIAPFGTGLLDVEHGRPIFLPDRLQEVFLE